MSGASAIIVAAGSGRRMRHAIPKQFLTIGTHPVLYHTLLPFVNCPQIREIIVVVASEYLQSDLLKASLPDTAKPIRSIAGGRQRQDSVYRGIQSIAESTGILVIHDAVRPLVTVDLIDRTIALCNEFDGAIAATPAVDTLKRVEDQRVLQTLDRSRIWQVQTPQTFRKAVIQRAYEEAFRDGFYATDDAALVERSGGRVTIVQSSHRNLKITHPEDLSIAEILMRNGEKT